jgi:hypothetical protein
MNRNAEIPSSDVAVGLGSHTAIRSTLRFRRPLRRVCAWCNRIAINAVEWGDDRWSRTPDPAVTHGICPRCAADINSL